MPAINDFSKKLVKLREAKNESLATVAAACNITTSALSMYENGARVPRDEIKVILAAYYGVTVGYLFYAEG